MARGRGVRASGLALLGVVLAVAVAGEIFLLLRLPNNPARSTDFLGYWSPSRLLLSGKSPYDQEAVQAIQAGEGWPESEPIFSWNPPSLYAILLPLAALPFDIAATVWFVINPVIIALSVLLAWRAFWGSGKGRVWIPFAAAFLFSRTLHTILVGQINTLVFLGLAGFVLLERKEREMASGALLALSTVKPHLGYLLLPLLFQEIILQRRWGILWGFLAAFILSLAVPTFLYPRWLGAYVSHFASNPPANYYAGVTSTLNSVLLIWGHEDLGRYLWVVTLPVMLLFVRIWKGRDLASVSSVALLVGLPTAPFGWSTDQIVVLLPILQIIAWTLRVEGVNRVGVVIVLGIIYAYVFILWLFYYREPLFVVVPLVLGILYAYCWKRAQIGSSHATSGS